MDINKEIVRKYMDGILKQKERIERTVLYMIIRHKIEKNIRPYSIQESMTINGWIREILAEYEEKGILNEVSVRNYQISLPDDENCIYPVIRIGTEPDHPYDDSKVIDSQRFSLSDTRPVTAQLWRESGYTFLTYFFSDMGLKDKSEEELFLYLKENGIKFMDEYFDKRRYSKNSGVDDSGSNYLSFTVTMGDI